MERVLEQELMDAYDQVRSYADINFDYDHHCLLQELDLHIDNKHDIGNILDIGCGPGVLTSKLGLHFRDANILAIDGAYEMISYAKSRFGSIENLDFQQVLLPSDKIPCRSFDLILSANFLHHLHRPEVLWETLLSIADKNTFIFIVDLYRPSSEAEAKSIVTRYGKDSPLIMQNDFYNSLLASFTEEEVKSQLQSLNINGLTIKKDRFLKVYGRIG